MESHELCKVEGFLWLVSSGCQGLEAGVSLKTGGLMGHAASPGLTASKGTGSSVVKLQRIAFCQPPE